MKNIMFERKVLLELLKCSEYELKDIQQFIEKYKRKYKTDIFPYFIKIFMKEYVNRIPEDCVLEQIWYFLLVKIIKRYIKTYGIKYCYDDFCNLQENFTKPKFRVKISNFRDLELELMRNGLSNGIINKIVNDLNWFLER